jgi:alkylation response protein AidB-like acyl-CoA dehydrogenase
MYPIALDHSEELDLIRDTARDFAAKHILPHVMTWDEPQTFPLETFKAMGKLGFMGVLVPEEYGGSGMGYDTYITIIDEISQVCGSIGLSVAAHNSLCTQHIAQFGNEEQKRKWLPKLATAEHLGAWGLTETGTGSDAGGMATTAIKDGEGWRMNGSKNFITHAISADVFVVIARTGGKQDSHGMTAFVLEKGMDGFSGGQKENKLGMRASETACLFFDNVFVPGRSWMVAVFPLQHSPLVLQKGREKLLQPMRKSVNSLVSLFHNFKAYHSSWRTCTQRFMRQS